MNNLALRYRAFGAPLEQLALEREVLPRGLPIASESPRRWYRSIRPT